MLASIFFATGRNGSRWSLGIVIGLVIGTTHAETQIPEPSATARLTAECVAAHAPVYRPKPRKKPPGCCTATCTPSAPPATRLSVSSSFVTESKPPSPTTQQPVSAQFNQLNIGLEEKTGSSCKSEGMANWELLVRALVLCWLLMQLLYRWDAQVIAGNRNPKRSQWLLTGLWSVWSLTLLGGAYIIWALTICEHWAMSSSLCLLWAGLTFPQTSRLWLLSRYSIRSYHEYPTQDPISATLTNSQQEFLNDLENRVRQNSPTQQLLAIKGDWGAGKTFLLKQLALKLAKAPQNNEPSSQTHGQSSSSNNTIPVIWVDLWRHQGMDQLQMAIIEMALAHPHFLKHHWRQYPLSALWRPMWVNLKRSFQRMNVDMKVTTVSLDFSKPVVWQSILQAVLCKNQCVLVCDELDRATPAATQEALTLVRRALDIPGVTTVLPLVSDQLAFKAFNPLIPSYSPELDASMEAVLFTDWQKQAAIDQVKRPDYKLRLWTNEPENSQDKSTLTDQGVDRRLRTELQRYYLETSLKDPNQLLRWQRQFQEKYLAVQLAVPHVGTNELYELLQISYSIHSGTEWPPTNGNDWRTATIWPPVKKAIEDIYKLSRGTQRNINLRSLMGSWAASWNKVNVDVASPSPDKLMDLTKQKQRQVLFLGLALLDLRTQLL